MKRKFAAVCRLYERLYHTLMLAARVGPSQGAVPVPGAKNTTAIGSSTQSHLQHRRHALQLRAPQRDNSKILKHGHGNGR